MKLIYLTRLKIKIHFICKFIVTLFFIYSILPINHGFSRENLDNPNPDVIIVGAGLAGLSTAYQLKKEGKSFVIIEMSPHIGGRIRTASYTENVSAEVGLEEFWENNPILPIFKELGIPLEKSATGFSSFISNGRINTFTQNTKTEFLKSFLTEKEINNFQIWDHKASEIYKKISTGTMTPDLLALKNISFANWVRKHKNLTLKVQEIIRIESEPEYATSWERISALDGILEWHLFSGEGAQSYHIAGGNHLGAIAIADSIGRDKIMLSQQVININSKSNGVEVITTDADFKQQTYFAKYVVTTMPLFRLNEIQFNPPLTSDRTEAIQTQTWGSYFTAHLIFSEEAQKYWTLNGIEILPILTDGPLGVIYSGNSPVDSKIKTKETILNLLVSGDHAEVFNNRAGSLDEVKAQLLKNLESLWPGVCKHLKKQIFYRYHPRAIASWPVGRSRLDSLSDLMRKPQGRVYFAGDFTEGTHSDGAAHSAIRVVHDIIEKETKKLE